MNMESNQKKCHSILTREFEKSLKKAGPKIESSIREQIEKLENYENNPQDLPKGIKSPELMYGKMLSSVNRTIYSLEPSFKIRALAHVTKREGVKVYVWLWGGTHEEYNNKIKASALHTEEHNSNKKHGQEIENKINDMSVTISKSQITENIKLMRENMKGSNHLKKQKYQKS